MRWSVAHAKQRFSELVRAASGEPQLVFNRSRLVAAVLDPGAYEAFREWGEQRGRLSLAEATVRLREICAEENYVLELPPRRDRLNPFAQGQDGGDAAL